MAAFFQSFRSSSMPKRLLRYALSRLELLDADALDMENLDFALGRNTVFEFRDVGIKLKELEKLLQLPAAFALARAKVLLLRVTIPMDFYTSPITVEVDGVEVRIKIEDVESSKPNHDAPPETSGVVPNTVDLAQSFLETQPKSERKQLEEALVAETQDLGASVSVSDDGSEEEPPLGTGQTLSLPDFLADFLQGIVDRTQVRIKRVTFQLDMDLTAADANATEPVSFQIALESIEVEGVTAASETDASTNDPSSPNIIPKEGKRHVSLANVRAYLISEANVFSSLPRSPSITSPSVSSSPTMTRQPPSRQSSSLLSQGSFREQPMAALQESFREKLSDHQTPDQDALGDSEEALGIPYEFEDESPPTPRASMLQGDGSLVDLVGSVDQAAELEAEPAFDHGQLPLRLAAGHSSDTDDGGSSPSPSASQAEDLAESHVYTHEEAESMYMSAFSSGTRTSPGASRLGQSSRPLAMDASMAKTSDLVNAPPTFDPEPVAETPASPVAQTSLSPVDTQPSPSRRSTMPGAWGEESEAPPEEQASPPEAASKSASDLLGDSMAIGEKDTEIITKSAEADDAPTPRGPSRVVKELMRLDCVSVYVPSQHRHINVQPASSVDLGSTASSTHKTDDPAIEVVLSPLCVYFDTPIGLLMAMAVEKLLKIVNVTADAKPRGQPETQAKPAPEFRLSAQEISLNFLSHLRGVADISERHLNPPTFADHEDILLNATLEKLSVSVASTRLSSKSGEKPEDATITRIDLERFRFGYADGDMISFDSGRPLSTSVRDTFLNEGHDIAVKMVRATGLNTTDIETLPLVVQLDVQRLDETIGWFGGLSSFLNTSASASGVHTLVQPTAPSPPPARRRPAVHFDTPTTRQPPMEAAPTFRNKTNVRIGGALIELAGRECSVAAETNTIKVVARDEGIGVACSRIRVSGPYVRSTEAYDHQSAPLVTEVGGLRLEMSPTPEDRDLEKLLELIIPSKVKFDDDGGEIMVETLLRQRRKGSVLRATVDNVNVRVGNPARLLPALPNLGEEVAKLSSTVAAKYLPDDDRPGILILAKVCKLNLTADAGGKIGILDIQVSDFEVANITFPSLVAVAVRGLTVLRNGTEQLVSSEYPQGFSEERNPVVMARIIGDEMEPTIKLKLRDLRIEYRVPTIMEILQMDDEITPQEFEAGLATSVASLADRALPKRQASQNKERPTALDIGLRDCLLGLNPLNLPSKLVLALTDARVQASLPSADGSTRATVNVNKASLLLIDDASETETLPRTTSNRRRRSSASASPQISDLCAKGFVDICYISSARIAATVKGASDKQVEVEVRDDLLVLETCADSTQTLIALFNALKPPTPPSKEDKYRTKVVPVQDLLASISAEAFGKPEGDYDFDYDFAGAQEMAGSASDVGYGTSGQLSPRDGSLMFDAQLSGEELFDADETAMQDTAEGVLLTGFDPPQNESVNDSGDDLVIHEDFYGRDEVRDGHIAKLWNPVKNTYDTAPDALVKSSPFKVSVKDVHVIWNLFDGYDWTHTRDVIAKAVEDVEAKATERQQLKQSRYGAEAFEEQEEEEETIGDFLFNSIYIGVPLNRDPRDLTRAINQGLNDADDDTITETESIATATTATTRTASRPHGRVGRQRRLRLNRSKHHKITFELRGVSADLVVYPPPGDAGLANRGQETLSSVDVRVQALDVFDHVPTSTWKKFATYDQDQGEREMGTSMVHLELLTVRPLPDLAASEIVMRATLLPLRLHVDQDALDFITRFFEFKPDDAPAPQSPNDIPFLQRAEILDVPVKLDFKPKRVDYAGLRSGHTTEFMNFITLEESRMTLRHVIVYGVSGFDRLGKTLNDIWSPDVRRNQLPGVVAGLAPVRSLVNIGSGFRDLVEIPLKEYQKDGRVIRSISKGAAAFARTTGTELVKLGAKLAVGTQYALQGAEEMLAEKSQRRRDDDEMEELTEEDRKQISLYADQPTGVLQGIRGGYRSLTRDVNLARDAIIAVPGEVIGSQSASGAARAVLRRAPTIIFRPAVGVTKVIGQTLLGATNTIDPHNRRRISEKYKH